MCRSVRVWYQQAMTFGGRTSTLQMPALNVMSGAVAMMHVQRSQTAQDRCRNTRFVVVAAVGSETIVWRRGGSLLESAAATRLLLELELSSEVACLASPAPLCIPEVERPGAWATDVAGGDWGEHRRKQVDLSHSFVPTWLAVFRPRASANFCPHICRADLGREV